MRASFSIVIMLLAIICPVSAENDAVHPCQNPKQPCQIGSLGAIEGSVTLFRPNQIPRQLDSKKDVEMPLNQGDTLQCGADSRAPGHLGKRLLPNLCQVGKLAAGLGNYDIATLAAFEEAGRIGGRNKGEDVPIYAPPDHGAVLPEMFVVQWRTRPPLDTFTAILQDSHGGELGRVPDVNGAGGVLKSDVLKDALVRYQKSDGDHIARLTFHDKTAPDQSVTFAVLTDKQESDLKRQLADVSTPADSFHYVERAAVFESFKLYSQVAAEYDSALKEAPESRYLLQATLNAYARIGDFQTARSLRDRLNKVEGDD